MLAVSPLSGKDFLPHAQIETLSKADAAWGLRDALNECVSTPITPFPATAFQIADA
jgi:hypothetical protein